VTLPQPDVELELPNFYFDRSSDDSEFDGWNEAFIADAEAGGGGGAVGRRGIVPR
jgi:hypothetical protein